MAVAAPDYAVHFIDAQRRIMSQGLVGDVVFFVCTDKSVSEDE